MKQFMDDMDQLLSLADKTVFNLDNMDNCVPTLDNMVHIFKSNSLAGTNNLVFHF